MKSIGFTNFRRFARLEPLELAPITFFVGGNNAGKSTVVKAMMLLLDNLAAKAIYTSFDKAIEMPSFRLDANRIHEVHIGTFGRALHKPYPEQKELILESEMDEYKVRYTIIGDTESKQANADIAKLELTNTSTNVQYIFDFVNTEATIKYNTSILKNYASMYARFSTQEEEELQSRLNSLLEQRASIQNELKTFEGDAVHLARLNSNLRSIERQIARVKKSIDPFEGKLKIEDTEYKCPINARNTENGMSLLSGLLFDIADRFEDRLDIEETNDSGTLTLSTPAHLSVQDKAFGRMIRREARRLSIVRSHNAIEYISAHAATQKVLFSIEDKNDYMAGVIRNFKQCRIEKGDQEDLFITRWMKELHIGLDYQIDSLSGEAYMVDITNMQGETMPLADMGMGSIQMMLLLFKLASNINKKNGDGCTIIVEEPEQNIHPQLQSKLTDLFLEVFVKYGFHFIIETHSEYMIRKSQVLVAQMGYETQEEIETRCPIKTYYFPGDMEPEKNPYNMAYRMDGKFMNGFGEGFYDEAANLAFDIM